ncbi:VOC family protein [Larkinella rosea]|uniref:VOC family protein n=1 Tax=Larkinella rosea TaxID=2025312 RepID=A0A3P1BB02_9BACT|nr:VOC family protein [Larkinella rosea]RRA98141.1 VOC family protein [Larkinella rosea]
MFTTTNAFSRFLVDDRPKVKTFCQQTLGLEVTEEHKGISLLTLHLGGGNKLLFYPKQDPSPATFTFLNFPVEDVNQAVDELTGKGIVVEHLQGDISTHEKGMSRGQGPTIA